MSNLDFENDLDLFVNNILQEAQNDLSNQNEAEDDFLQVNEEFINFDREKRKQKEEDDSIRRVLDYTFDDPFVAQGKELLVDSDFLELYFADSEEKNKIILKMTSQQRKEYEMLETEYRKEDFDVPIRDLERFGGSGLRNNRFKRQLEPLTELDGFYPEEFLRLYYAPSNERFNIESKLNVLSIGKGSLQDHEKMVIAYQKEPEEYQRQTEKYIKKKKYRTTTPRTEYCG